MYILQTETKTTRTKTAVTSSIYTIFIIKQVHSNRPAGLARVAMAESKLARIESSVDGVSVTQGSFRSKDRQLIQRTQSDFILENTMQ